LLAVSFSACAFVPRFVSTKATQFAPTPEGANIDVYLDEEPKRETETFAVMNTIYNQLEWTSLLNHILREARKIGADAVIIKNVGNTSPARASVRAVKYTTKVG